MVQTVEAIYEAGILRPLQPLQGVREHSTVRLRVEMENESRHPLADCIGILPDQDAAEMQQAIEDEFEKVDLSAWQ